MSTKKSLDERRSNYEAQVKKDIEWLKTHPITEEREHIIMILEHSVELLYPRDKEIREVQQYQRNVWDNLLLKPGSWQASMRKADELIKKYGGK